MELLPASSPAPSATALADFEGVRRHAMQSLFANLEALCEGTLVVDRNARVVWINERYAARFGLKSAAEAIGQEVERIIPGSLMREVVQSGQPILLDILETGSRSFIVTRLPLKDDRGQVIGAVGLALYESLQPLSPLFSKFLRLQEELDKTRKSLQEARRTRYTFSNFIGISPACLEVKRQARRAAQLDSPVLLLGETGTGKELLAQSIHAASPRAHRPFIALNVAAIPETLLETEFFGVAPGAYTGADRKGREGKFALAEGGTLFLDEIGDMPLFLQAKLLRVLQEREFEAVGSNRVQKADVRIIAATSTDLPALVEAGRFRADLYYRLNVLTLPVPPLRERLADLELLCEAVLEQLAIVSGQPQRELSAEAVALLRTQPWRGNVRELRNVLERAAMLSESSSLGAAELAPILPVPPRRELATVPAAAPAEVGDAQAIPLHAEAMAAFERQLIARALATCDGRVSEAARRLGLGRATLYKKMAALGLMSPF
jgi:transcriptional regulator with PAS, ATPase and Fis domain